MVAILNAEELALFRHIPETDLVELAIELDVPVGETIDRAALLNTVVVSLAQRARAEGLPFSEYDRDDLSALPRDQLTALASLCGVGDSIDDLLKLGRKVFKVYRKQRPRSQISLLLPMLLAPLARHAASTEGRGAFGP